MSNTKKGQNKLATSNANKKTDNTLSKFSSEDILIEKVGIEEIDRKIELRNKKIEKLANFLKLFKHKEMFYVFKARDNNLEFDITKNFAIKLGGWLTGYNVDNVEFEVTGDGYVVAKVYVKDLYTGMQMIGVAEEKLETGVPRVDKFARRKAMAKAVRNAYRDIISPAIIQYLRRVYEAWYNTLSAKEQRQLLNSNY
ncbi:MAG: hypothetical protein GF317_10270 [Candidatus Lokiarchaeota archaeon]|nr:hypothetical protein [Candidatus Lokiarchaeota archaeon]